MEAIVKTLVVIGVLGVMIGIILCTVPAFRPIDTQYSCSIEVDKSEKIEQALANAIEDVSSRKFIVVSTSVKYCFVDKTFKIEVKGIDKGSLLAIGD